MSIGELSPPPIRLPADAVEELATAVGRANVLTDDESRVRHTRGKSTPDLLRIRAGDVGDAPDLVLAPRSHDEVLEVLRICTARRVGVVPFGGGTSVVGGLEPVTGSLTGVVALDLGRMNALLELDEESRLAGFLAGQDAIDAAPLVAARKAGISPRRYAALVAQLAARGVLIPIGAAGSSRMVHKSRIHTATSSSDGHHQSSPFSRSREIARHY